MLARWPIRRKLLLAMLTMLAIVGILAFSGFRGVYAYRSLAGTITLRSAELPLSSALTREAAGLRHTFDTIRRSQHARGPLNGLTLSSERERFRHGLADMASAVRAYRDQLDGEGDAELRLSDRSRERQMVAQIEERLEAIGQLTSMEHWALGQLDEAELQHALDRLNDDVNQLPTFLQQRMAGFRDEVRGQYRTWIVMTWAGTVLALAMFAALMFLFRRLVMRPFRQLMQGCRKVASGQFDHRISLGTRDELAELAGVMNQMVDRFQRTYKELEDVCRDLDRQVQDQTREVIRSEHLASVGFLAAGVAHEINNPMAAIAWSAEALEGRLYDTLQPDAAPQPLAPDQVDALRDNLRRIQQEAFRCKEITDRLLDFSRLGDVQRRSTDLKPLVEDVAAMISTLGQYRGKKIRVECPSPVVALVNPQEIKQVVLNLLTNALESLGSSGTVRIHVGRDPEAARIAVEDDGCGMTDEVRDHLFEPFFTRRRDGRGTGLGLSITYRIVQKHGGRITAHSDGPGRGSRLDVTLPLDTPLEGTDELRQAA